MSSNTTRRSVDATNRQPDNRGMSDANPPTAASLGPLRADHALDPAVVHFRKQVIQLLSVAVLLFLTATFVGVFVFHSPIGFVVGAVLFLATSSLALSGIR